MKIELFIDLIFNSNLRACATVSASIFRKIVQSLNENEKFKRGDEKGYFLFGGSTVVVLGMPGKCSPSLDILNNTKNKKGTYLKLGEEVARIS